MKHFIKFSLITLFSGLILFGCSDLKNDIPQAPKLSVHKDGILNVNSPNFHGNLVKQDNWSMDKCIQCHAADFTGGITGQSCFQCHKETAGPLACNTCHGDFKNPDRIAPPRDTKGNKSTTEAGVGAHWSHLYTNDLTNSVTCSNCHTVPDSVYQKGHISSQPAVVKLTGLAIANKAINASFNYETLTCSNTYCHGNFEFKKSDADPTNQFAYTSDKMVGNNFTPTWNEVDDTQAKCGSCHGLPPTGHIDAPITACFLCHQGVIDQYGNIIDKDKHINGYKSARGSLQKLQEFLSQNK